MAAEGAPTPVPKTRRPLFNRPAWSRPQATTEAIALLPKATTEAVQLFSRSQQLFPGIVSEQEARRKRLLEKREARARGDTRGTSTREGKRRRISHDADDDDVNNHGRDGVERLSNADAAPAANKKDPRQAFSPSASGHRHGNDDDDDGLLVDRRSAGPNPPAHKRGADATTALANTFGRSSSTAPIEIVDSEDEEVSAAPRHRPLPPPSLSNTTFGGNGSHAKNTTASCQVLGNDDDEEEELFPEIARRAREGARLREQDGGTSGAGALSGNGPFATVTSSAAAADPLRGAAAAVAAGTLGASDAQAMTGTSGASQSPLPSQPPPEADATVDILITSPIPGTRPLIVQRRLQQNLRDVRFAWCAHQGFTAERALGIFLAWRGKRLFDVTTCKSLGIGVGTDGRVQVAGERDADGRRHLLCGDEARQIHMEALTAELLEEARRRQQQWRNGGGGLGSSISSSSSMVGGTSGGDGGAYNSDAADASHATPQTQSSSAPPEKEEEIRLILKSKGYDDYKLIVKPSTKISKIVQVFRKSMKITDECQVFLVFDGDRLAPDATVVATEIADMDRIDVHIKR